MFDTDEHPKPKTTLEQLAKLPTVFKKVKINYLYFFKLLLIFSLFCFLNFFLCVVNLMLLLS